MILFCQRKYCYVTNALQNIQHTNRPGNNFMNNMLRQNPKEPLLILPKIVIGGFSVKLERLSKLKHK